MERARQVLQCLMQISVVQLDLSTFQSASMMMKHTATKSKDFQQTLSNPRGISFGTGDPNVLMATSGHISQKGLQAYVAKHGPMEAFICELSLAYLYQYWENIIRPQLKAIIGEEIVSDVFGDLRIIRNALQHEKHKHISEARNIDGLKMFSWLRDRSEARLTGDAFDAIMYAISLDLHRLNNQWGEGPANVTAVPTFFARAEHFGIKDLSPKWVEKLAAIAWYKYYVLDTSKSAILALETVALGNLRARGSHAS